VEDTNKLLTLAHRLSPQDREQNRDSTPGGGLGVRR